MRRKILLWVITLLTTSFLTCNAADSEIKNEESAKITRDPTTSITIYPHLFGYKFQRSNYIHQFKIPGELVLSNITINGQAITPSEITKQALAYDETHKLTHSRRWLRHYFEKIEIPTTETNFTLEFTLSFSYEMKFNRDPRYRKKWQYQDFSKVDQVTLSITTNKTELYLGYSEKNGAYMLQEEPNYISVGPITSYIIPDGLFG